MKNMQVTTGFGYFKDNQNHIIAKAELPPGNHPIKDGFTYIEVGDKAELDAIEIYKDPAETEKQQNEIKIATKIRQTAINQLIVEGQLPAGYK